MANLKVKEMTEVIKKQIEAYTKDTKLESIGSVLSVGDGIAIVYGLKDAMMGELLVFPHNVSGLVFNLEEDAVGVILLGQSHLVKEGDLVKTTGKIFRVTSMRRTKATIENVSTSRESYNLPISMMVKTNETYNELVELGYIKQ